MAHFSAASWLRWLAVAILLFQVSAIVLAREKTDLVVLANGSRLLVEVRSMDRGLLKAKTDEIGTISIEWDDIVAVSSGMIFDVTVENGEKYVGSLEEGSETGILVVRGDGEPVSLEMSRVVMIYPLDASFFKRIRGSLDLGYSIKSEDNISQLNLGLDAQYNTNRLLRRLSVDANYSGRDKSDASRQSQAWFEVTRFLLKHPRWATAGLLLGQANTDMSLDYRYLGGAMFGRVLAVSNRNLLILFAGAAYSDEHYTGDLVLSEEGIDQSNEAGDQSFEGVLLLGYQGFAYDSPKYNVDVRLMVLPGITVSDRLRLQFQGGVSYEIFHNFTAGVSAGYAYDSQPPMAGLQEYSYILGATIGYSFN
jgi:hypothetical protein